MSGNFEFWSNLTTAEVKDASAVAKRAERLEADGWDGGTFVDSQCLRAEAFVSLAWCAHATSKLKLGTGTGNPATRHPSVNAASAATLQVLSKGRMVFGIGRGDSALAYIGASPVTVDYFERTVAMTQAYLAGESVPVEEAASVLDGAPKGFKNLAVAAAPTESSLEWLPKDVAKTPLEVSCTGPKVIGVAARHADFVSFAVGADLDRLKWCLSVAKEELQRAGRDASKVRFGAYLPLFPHPDVDVSRKMAQGITASHSRFAVINKKVAGQVSEHQRKVLEKVGGSYDMTHHGQTTADQVKALDEEYIDNFSLVGDPAQCVDRIRAVMDLGIERLHLWTAPTEIEAGRVSYELSVDKVLAKLK